MNETTAAELTASLGTFDSGILGSGTVTNEYGAEAPEGYTYQTGYHTGIDIVLTNSLVLAYCAGTIVSISSEGAYGNHIWIEDSAGYSHLYAHLESVNSTLSVGDYVAKNAYLGKQGSTGNSTGDHLHYEVRKDISDPYSSVDPTAYNLGLISTISSSVGGSFEAVGNTVSNFFSNLFSTDTTSEDSTIISAISSGISSIKENLMRGVIIFIGAIIILMAIKEGFLGGGK